MVWLVLFCNCRLLSVIDEHDDRFWTMIRFISKVCDLHVKTTMEHTFCYILFVRLNLVAFGAFAARSWKHLSCTFAMFMLSFHRFACVWQLWKHWTGLQSNFTLDSFTKMWQRFQGLIKTEQQHQLDIEFHTAVLHIHFMKYGSRNRKTS